MRGMRAACPATTLSSCGPCCRFDTDKRATGRRQEEVGVSLGLQELVAQDYALVNILGVVSVCCMDLGRMARSDCLWRADCEGGVRGRQDGASSWSWRQRLRSEEVIAVSRLPG
jgi:hypothetical protein